jgi:hypothetical protein
MQFDFSEPMVPAEFGYSTRGALAAFALALGAVSLLYAFTLWPGETGGWLAVAGFARYVGRHPIEKYFG